MSWKDLNFLGTVNDDELKRVPKGWILTDYKDNIFIYE